MDRKDRNIVGSHKNVEGSDDKKLMELIPENLYKKFREELEMARELLPSFDKKAFKEGTQTPIWFGSAINSFGVQELMNGIAKYAPKPQFRRHKRER